MKNKQWSRFFTETGILSLIIVYSYAVYLFGEIGSLSALGINDIAALFTLDIQNILLGFLRAILYFIGFLVILVILSLAISKAKPDSRKYLRIKNMSFIIIVLVMMVTYSPIIYNQLGKLGLVLLLLLNIILLVLFIIRMPNRKRSFLTAFDDFLEKNLLSNEKLPRFISVIIPGIVASLFFIPFFNYLFNYNAIAIQPNSSIQKVTVIDKDTYWIARIYSDKYILVKLDKYEATPSYLILNSSYTEDFKFILKEIKIDSQKLHPKTIFYQKINDRL